MREANHCRDDTCLCPISGIIEVISKKWAICIISLLEENKILRFNEIKRELKEISPKTLSDELKELEKAGLITRQVYPETPPRVEYSLTEDGKKLREILMPLVDWVRKKDKQTK